MLQKLVQPETLAERAYKELKKAIIEERFMPGDPLPEESLASMLGISRTPIRKAITRLSYEGLIEVETGKVARVARIEPEDITHLVELRKVLEPMNVEQIVPYVTPKYIDELERIQNEQERAIQNNDLDLFIEWDTKFHIYLAQMNPNKKLKDFIEQLNTDLQRRYLILSGTLEDSAEAACQEHVDIIQALRLGQAESARKAMDNHIRNIEMRLKS